MVAEISTGSDTYRRCRCCEGKKQILKPETDNGHGTTWKKIEDKWCGCCEQRPENGGTGKKDGGSQEGMVKKMNHR